MTTHQNDQGFSCGGGAGKPSAYQRRALEMAMRMLLPTLRESSHATVR